jgi:hypothetical protein
MCVKSTHYGEVKSNRQHRRFAVIGTGEQSTFLSNLGELGERDKLKSATILEQPENQTPTTLDSGTQTVRRFFLQP